VNIESLVKEAVNILDSKWKLPKTGFIAGGSISNIIWELVSGNKAVINDIDIFYFDGTISQYDLNLDKSLFKWDDKEKKYWEDYTGIRSSWITKTFYTVEESRKDCIFNYIKYKSNTNDADLILKSFDINSTAVGYSIDEGKAYWTDEFEDFLKTGNLKVNNLMTPSHTVIRIMKKKHELNCQLDEFEMKLLKCALSWRFNDIIKYKFQDRYHQMFIDYKDYLQDFKITRDHNAEQFVKSQKGVETKLYYLESNTENDDMRYINDINDSMSYKIYNSGEFLFYIRNIIKNDTYRKVWNKLSPFFIRNTDYVDMIPSDFELTFLGDIISKFPNTIENLRGFKISEQISLIKELFKKFSDPVSAISILETYKIDLKNLDESDLFLLELSVRKKLVDKSRIDKVNSLKLYDYFTI
jgi:hypothetical protein